MDWGLVSIIVTLAIAILVWVRRRYFTRPELTIEVVFDGAISSRLGASNKNTPVETVGDTNNLAHIFDAENTLFVFELEWHINLVIRNNSEFAAFYPKIHFKSDKVRFAKIEPLNNQIPIASKAEVVLKAEYKELEESIGRNRTQIHGLPAAFNNLVICLEYKNASKRTYFSIYNNKDKQTLFRRKLSRSYSWKI